jgi:hypothetical protein
MVLKRSEIARPALPKETVAFPPLGGDVVVRGLLLGERLAMMAAGARRDPAAPEPDGPELFAGIASGLAWCVLDADGEPLLSAAEWQVLGAQHIDACLELWRAVKRLSGMDREALEKKSGSTPT